MQLDVLPAVHLIAEPWRLKMPTTDKNCFAECGFLIDCVNTNDHSTVKLTEVEEVWHSLYLGVHSEDYPNHIKKRKLQNKQQHYQMHWKNWKKPEITYIDLITRAVLL
jgi:hypothetical protein